MSLSTYQKTDLFEIISISFRFTLGYIMNSVICFYFGMKLPWDNINIMYEDGMHFIATLLSYFLNQVI